MANRIEWVGANTRLLKEIAAEFRATQPFAGMTIGTGIHLEPKTVALLLTLRDGARQGGGDRQPQHHAGRRRRLPEGARRHRHRRGDAATP